MTAHALPPRVLITGGTGFIGRALVRAWQAERAQVGVLARGAGAAGIAGVEAFSVDLLDAGRTAEAVARFQPDVCYHLASHPDAGEDHRQALLCIDGNLVATANLLDALRDRPDCLLVIGDSVKVYGSAPPPFRSMQTPQPVGSYAITKLAAWHLALQHRHLYGMRVVALRPNLVYGPGQPRNIIRFVAESVLSGADEVPLMGGTQTRDPLFIDDAIGAFRAAADIGDAHLGTAIPIGGGSEVSVADLAGMVVALSGRRARIRSVESAIRPTDMLRCVTDTSEAESMLNWKPRWTLEQGLCATLAAMGLAIPFKHPSAMAQG